ncbi:MAG TPA: GGDEF domain-containing protein [Ilumatobacteraceae bacterium]|nr:GGDEF domain-containing protein [Ilumatobacteraceae bacterium]
MRLGALFGSVMLIVAVAVGYVARRADLAHSRDVQIESSASVASANLGGFIKAAELSAAVGTDPRVASESLSAALEGADVCVVARNAAAAAPACSTLDVAFGQRANARLAASDRKIAGVGDRLEITVVGDAATVYAEVFLADLGILDNAQLDFAKTTEAPPVVATTVDDRRVAATLIDHGDGLWVAASTDGGVSLASEEQLMIVMLSSLAVLLLGLAGMTIRAERRSLVERASLDTLTRLPNRSEFERRAEMVLAAAQRSENGVCLLLFDLDGFKAINDTHGHQAGDEVLRVMGKRLRRAVRESDVVARWGGDEFVLMLPGIEDASAARTRAASLAELISREDIDGLRVGASVGIALFPRHAETLPTLIEAADGAMYAAKRDGDSHRLAGVESAPIDPIVEPAADRRAAANVT